MGQAILLQQFTQRGKPKDLMPKIKKVLKLLKKQKLDYSIVYANVGWSFYNPWNGHKTRLDQEQVTITWTRDKPIP